MIYIYKIHCPKCEMNVTIETDSKSTKKHRCSKCGRIMKDDHLSEERNIEVLKKLEKESRTVKEEKPKKKKRRKNEKKVL